MPGTPARVTQADIAQAIRAMRAAGYQDVRVVFRDGSIIVEPLPEEAALSANRPKKPERLIIL